MESIEQIMYKGFTIKVYRDQDYDSPNDWDTSESFLVYDHRDFYIKVKGFDPGDIWEQMQELPKKKTYEGFYFFPVYTYIHSGVALSLGRSQYPFTDHWDVSFKGFYLVKRQKYYWTRDKAYKLAEQKIEIWNQYLSGDVYGYVIEDSEGNEVDSCWGFYGCESYEEPHGYMLTSYCYPAIDYEIKQRKQSHFTLLKTWIKNRVPFQYRHAFSI